MKKVNRLEPPSVDLFGNEVVPAKRINDRPEAAALHEVLLALRNHPAVSWAERQNSGAAKVGNRYIRFGWPGASDIVGQTTDGRFIACEVKSPTGKLRPEQAIFLERVRSSGGVGFVARDCRDVFNKLGAI